MPIYYYLQLNLKHTLLSHGKKNDALSNVIQYQSISEARLGSYQTPEMDCFSFEGRAYNIFNCFFAKKLHQRYLRGFVICR